MQASRRLGRADWSGAPRGNGPRVTHHDVTIQGTPRPPYYSEPMQVLNQVTYVQSTVPGQTDGCELLIAWGTFRLGVRMPFWTTSASAE